jgi:DNA-binding Lrp family transcriptional regulator
MEKDSGSKISKKDNILPKKVSETLETLKKKYNIKLTIARSKNNYYVYQYNVWVNPITGRKDVIKMMYIGSIHLNGEFAPAQRRKNINFEESIEASKRLQFFNSFSKKEVLVLRNLSMNARMPLNALAKRINSKSSTVAKIIDYLEGKLGLHYFAQLNLKKLGFLRYIIFIKFENEKPSIEEIRKTFENDPRVLLVAMLNGQYDLMVYICLENNIPIMDFIYTWRKNKLANYKAKWFITPFSQTYGGAIIREPFFELLKERVWHRTKEQPHKFPWQLSKSEYKVLKDLSINGRISFKELALKNGLSNSTASSYILNKLKERDIIQRITLNMSNLPLRYYVIFNIEIKDWENFVKYDNKELIKEELSFQYQWINKYSIVGDITTPVGTIVIAPILNEDDYYKYEQTFKYLKSCVITTTLITNVLVGSIINRNFDNTYANEYKLLVEEYKIKQEEKINYDI